MAFKKSSLQKKEEIGIISTMSDSMSVLRVKKIISVFLILIFGMIPVFSFAEVSKGASLSSDSFRILDSQHSIFGGTASSSSQSFILTTTIGDFAIGSSSITNFGLRSGFLYFPEVTAPVLNTATAGNGQVALSWTAATAYQGWVIGGYNVCYKSTGSYTCADVGNVISSTKTGLTNGTSYTFKIEAQDGLGNVIATSNERSATPVSPSPTPTPTPTPGGGGGGGGFISTGTGTIIIEGVAYPKSTVNVLLDGTFVSQIDVDANSKFTVTLNTVSTGSRLINLFSTDINNRKSITTSLTVTVTSGTTTSLTDILMPPTIDLNSTNIPKNGDIRIFGYAEPDAIVNVYISSEHESITKIISDSNGSYAIIFNTSPLAEDEHITKSRAIFEELLSPFSHTLRFFIGKAGIKTADLNKDGKVNIIDFSILLFWWNTNQQRGLDIADINNDSKVNIVDFSIMLFQWTG